MNKISERLLNALETRGEQHTKRPSERKDYCLIVKTKLPDRHTCFLKLLCSYDNAVNIMLVHGHKLRALGKVLTFLMQVLPLPPSACLVCGNAVWTVSAVLPL